MGSSLAIETHKTHGGSIKHGMASQRRNVHARHRAAMRQRAKKLGIELPHKRKQAMARKKRLHKQFVKGIGVKDLPILWQIGKHRNVGYRALRKVAESILATKQYDRVVGMKRSEDMIDDVVLRVCVVGNIRIDAATPIDTPNTTS